MITATLFEIPSDDMPQLEVVRAAHARGMHLIHNGRRMVVSPVIPPGWREVVIKVVDRTKRRAA